MGLKFIKPVLIIFTSVIFFSCKKSILIQKKHKEVFSTLQKSDSIFERIKFKYIYNFRIYNDLEWNNISKKENSQYYMVGFNNQIYVFDSKKESEKFENGQVVPQLNLLMYLNRDSDCSGTGNISVFFKIKLYNSKNYINSNCTFTWYNTVLINRNTLGVLSENQFIGNFPENLFDKISSYKVLFLASNGCKNGVKNYGDNFNLNINFYTKKIEDLNFNNFSDSYITTSISEFGEKGKKDLSRNKLFPILPPNNSNSWDNKIKSYKVFIYSS